MPERKHKGKHAGKGKNTKQEGKEMKGKGENGKGKRENDNPIERAEKIYPSPSCTLCIKLINNHALYSA